MSCILIFLITIGLCGGETATNLPSSDLVWNCTNNESTQCLVKYLGNGSMPKNLTEDYWIKMLTQSYALQKMLGHSHQEIKLDPYSSLQKREVGTSYGKRKPKRKFPDNFPTLYRYDSRSMGRSTDDTSLRIENPSKRDLPANVPSIVGLIKVLVGSNGKEVTVSPATPFTDLSNLTDGSTLVPTSVGYDDLLGTTDETSLSITEEVTTLPTTLPSTLESDYEITTENDIHGVNDSEQTTPEQPTMAILTTTDLPKKNTGDISNSERDKWSTTTEPIVTRSYSKLEKNKEPPTTSSVTTTTTSLKHDENTSNIPLTTINEGTKLEHSIAKMVEKTSRSDIPIYISITPSTNMTSITEVPTEQSSVSPGPVIDEVKILPVVHREYTVLLIGIVLACFGVVLVIGGIVLICYHQRKRELPNGVELRSSTYNDTIRLRYDEGLQEEV